jgi:hypothetical protein
MIAGLSGELISHAYLEQLVLQELSGVHLARPERGIVRWWRHVARTLGPVSSVRAIHDSAVIPLLRILGYEPDASRPDARGMFAALAAADAIVLTIPWSMPPRSAWRDAVARGTARQASWALISNGRSLRIVDCSRAWTRASIELDFQTLTLSRAGIAALWLLASQPSLSSRGPASLHARVMASDGHATAVCRALGDGVLEALPRLAGDLGRRRRTDAAAFDQALTVVFRILFLLFAEARSLVPTWHQLYRNGYTIEMLTRKALQARSTGLWAAFQAISRLAHAGCVAGDLSVTAFNGRLFSPRHAPLADRQRVSDEIMRDLLLALATTATHGGRRLISYHDLGVEQLGSVYERVLEYEPVSGGSLSRTSIRRKTTGSFYTPRSLTEFLVQRTLGPLVSDKSADGILDLRIVDPAMGSGAFLVAACRYLTECCEQALIRDGQWHEHDATDRRSSLRRAVAERCLYGVDLNPTAVQLSRLSLWLTTLAADRPLTFLDHHLAVGNSLIGTWLADLPMPPRSTRARGPLPLFDDQISGDLSARVIPARLRLALEPSDNIDAVRSKERLLAGLGGADGPLSRWSAAADAWCAAALWKRPPLPPALVREWIAMATGSATSLPAAHLRTTLEQAGDIVAEHAPFHWELAFPEVFFDADGRLGESRGFDAVIGNPPWDVMRADTGSASERRQSQETQAAALRFFKASRSYRLPNTGHANRYQLFVERAVQLARRGGRIGLLLPSGIATDHGSEPLRRHLLDRTTIDTWIGFDNRHRIFPIHRGVRFIALSTTTGGCTSTLRFRCGVTDPEELHRDGFLSKSVSLSRARIGDLSPSLTIPEITSHETLSILTGISDRIPALGDPRGWHVRFGRELNATDDRSHFVPLPPDRGSILPIVEGKQLSPFRADLSRSTSGIDEARAASLVDRASSFDRDRIAYREVASATNKLTLIAAMLPAGTISTHTVFCVKTALDDVSQWALLGLLNSLVANYLVRLAVATHVTAAIMSRLRVPKPDVSDASRLADLAHSLADQGIDHAAGAYAELNAIAARLYGLTREEYAFILGSFPLLSSALRERGLAVYSGSLLI